MVFGIVVSSLVGIGIGCYMIYNAIEKRRIKKKERLAEADPTSKRNVGDKRRIDEGSMFRGRSTQAGSSNAQGWSHSPARSYVLSPTTSNVNWSRTAEDLMGAPSSSNGISPLPVTPQRARLPITQRLQPSDAELSGRLNHGPSTNFGATGGAYLPPLASPRSPLSAGNSNSRSPTGWVSPLDVHFIKQSTGRTGSTPSSPAPSVCRVLFPEESRKGNGSTPASPFSVPSSHSALSSVHNNTTTLHATEVTSVGPEIVEPAQTFAAWAAATGPGYPEPAHVSPTVSPLPYPSYSQRQDSLANSSIDSGDSQSASKRTIENIPKPMKTSEMPPTSQMFPLPPSPFDDSNAIHEYKNTAVVRSSVVSKRTVYIHPANQSPRLNSLTLSTLSPTPTPTDSQCHTQQRLSASSFYSTRTSIVVESKSDNCIPRSSYFPYYQENTQANELHQLMPTEPTLLAMAQSSNSFIVDNENNSEGSPFSNAHEISTHSPSLSASSNSTEPRINDLAHSFVLDLNLPERNRSFTAPGRDSIGDFYDTYYHEPTTIHEYEESLGYNFPTPDVGSTNGDAKKLPLLKFDGLFSPQIEMVNMF